MASLLGNASLVFITGASAERASHQMASQNAVLFSNRKYHTHTHTPQHTTSKTLKEKKCGFPFKEPENCFKKETNQQQLEGELRQRSTIFFSGEWFSEYKHFQFGCGRKTQKKHSSLSLCVNHDCLKTDFSRIEAEGQSLITLLVFTSTVISCTESCSTYFLSFLHFWAVLLLKGDSVQHLVFKSAPDFESWSTLKNNIF